MSRDIGHSPNPMGHKAAAMSRRLFYAAIVSVMILGVFGLGLAAGQGLDGTLGRYPGAARLSDDVIEVQPADHDLMRFQASYQTPDALPLVRTWYAARLHLSPGSELYLTGSDGCAWLTQSHQLSRIEHTVTVLLCPRGAGTQMTVNESLSVE